jgi:hypothetical protein
MHPQRCGTTTATQQRKQDLHPYSIGKTGAFGEMHGLPLLAMSGSRFPCCGAKNGSISIP